jgi:hypothetical protein
MPASSNGAEPNRRLSAPSGGKRSHIKDQNSTRLKNSSEFKQSTGSKFDRTNYIRTDKRTRLIVVQWHFFDRACLIG